MPSTAGRKLCVDDPPITAITRDDGDDGDQYQHTPFTGQLRRDSSEQNPFLRMTSPFNSSAKVNYLPARLPARCQTEPLQVFLLFNFGNYRILAILAICPGSSLAGTY